MSARSRRALLRELLSGAHASTQVELQALLAAQGHVVTQSTVSRDLKRLGALRATTEDGEPVYRLYPPPRGLNSDMVVAVEHNETMLVLHTPTGLAQAVGIDLDTLEHPEILGTLAGDDTVLVIPRTVSRIAALAATLRSMIGHGSSSPSHTSTLASPSSKSAP